MATINESVTLTQKEKEYQKQNNNDEDEYWRGKIFFSLSFTLDDFFSASMRINWVPEKRDQSINLKTLQFPLG